MPLGFWNVHLYHDPAACWTFPAEIVVRIPFPNGWREGENSRFLCRVNYWHHNAKRERTAKGFTWFYSIISKRRRNRRRLQCGSSDFGLFFFSKVPLWHAARFGRCQSSAVATSRDFGSIEAWQTVVAWQKLWTSRWIDAGSWYHNASLKMPKSSRRHQYCTILYSIWYVPMMFCFACFCLQILVSASSASLSWWFQNKNCAAGQRGCWMTETSAWRLLGAAACLTARRFPWKKQRSQRPRHHSCPKLWQLCVIMHRIIVYHIVITHVGQTLCTGQLNLCLW